MQPVDPTTFQLDQRIEKPLYHASGVKLLGTGTRITRHTLRLLRRLNDGELFEGEPTPIERAKLNASTAYSEAISRVASEDEWFAGPPAGSGVIEFHEERDIVKARARQLKHAQERVADKIPFWEKLPRRIHAVGQQGAEYAVFGWPEYDELKRQHSDAVRRITLLSDQVLSGERVQRDDYETIVEELLVLRRADPRRFAGYALMRCERSEYLPQHSYANCCMAIASAELLEWDEYSVVKAGLASLVADIGMRHLPIDILKASRPLNDIEINRVWRHPSYSVVLLDSVDGLPEDVTRAVYEHHERENGTGYPRATRADAISDLAKLIGTTDTFAASVFPRPYRPRKAPHDAISELVRQTADGVFSREMAGAIVRSIGLYPVGSVVKLSDMSAARVIACNPEHFNKPIVMLEHPRGEDGVVIDLASEPEGGLTIARVVPEGVARSLVS